MDPLLPLIALGVGASVAMLFVYGYEQMTAPARTVRSSIAPATNQPGPAPPLRGGRNALAALVRFAPVSSRALERMSRDLVVAGQPVTAEQYVAIRALFAAGGAVAVIVLAPGLVPLPQWVLAAAAILAAALGWALPAMYVGQLRTRRLYLVEQQMPDALTIIAKSLRAGAGLLQALGYAAEEIPSPLGPELQTTLRDLQLGADAEDAFEALSQRVGSPDLDIAVTAIIIQRSVGGNLAEILSTVSVTIRERGMLQAEVRVLTSRQRLTPDPPNPRPDSAAGTRKQVPL